MYWALPNSEYYHPVRLLLDHLPLLAFIDLSQHTSFLHRDKSESNRSPKFTDTPSRSMSSPATPTEPLPSRRYRWTAMLPSLSEEGRPLQYTRFRGRTAFTHVTTYFVDPLGFSRFVTSTTARFTSGWGCYPLPMSDSHRLDYLCFLAHLAF